jgi:hypothetical protein
LDPRRELQYLIAAYTDVIDWCTQQAADFPFGDHTDELFLAITFRACRDLHLQTVQRLTRAVERADIHVDDLRLEYQRLAGVFRVEIDSFERKQYVNLSHESNKATNLNSYLGLLGMTVREVVDDRGLYLDVRDTLETDAAVPGSKLVPDARYVITLDADSLLSPEYALRLIDVMERPGFEDVAVVQTPYSAVPNAPGVLERVAGATTDLQYIIHQGFTWCGATFWVGANALLRKAALDDIRTVDVERGFPVVKYIQDRTVIEDTESTVDLVARRWRLYNYPDRLAYSATPPDFGALLIQRRRWANGGLIILPKLIRYAFSRPWRPSKSLEVLMRVHYLVSICGVNVGLLLLLLVPFGDATGSVWLPLTAAPYFALYWRDLVQSGYRRGDIFRVYALNVLLLPVNLGGVLKSLHQGLTGKKIPFGRTPKVLGRTAAPASYVAAEFLLLAFCMVAFAWDALTARWLHAAFSFGNAVILGYAIAAFVGLRASVEDLGRPWARRGIRLFHRHGLPISDARTALGRFILTSRQSIPQRAGEIDVVAFLQMQHCHCTGCSSAQEYRSYRSLTAA